MQSDFISLQDSDRAYTSQTLSNVTSGSRIVLVSRSPEATLVFALFLSLSQGRAAFSSTFLLFPLSRAHENPHFPPSLPSRISSRISSRPSFHETTVSYGLIRKRSRGAHHRLQFRRQGRKHLGRQKIQIFSNVGSGMLRQKIIERISKHERQSVQK